MNWPTLLFVVFVLLFVFWCFYIFRDPIRTSLLTMTTLFGYTLLSCQISIEGTIKIGPWMPKETFFRICSDPDAHRWTLIISAVTLIVIAIIFVVQKLLLAKWASDNQVEWQKDLKKNPHLRLGVENEFGRKVPQDDGLCDSSEKVHQFQSKPDAEFEVKRSPELKKPDTPKG